MGKTDENENFQFWLLTSDTFLGQNRVKDTKLIVCAKVYIGIFFTALGIVNFEKYM